MATNAQTNIIWWIARTPKHIRTDADGHVALCLDCADVRWVNPLDEQPDKPILACDICGKAVKQEQSS